MDLLLKGIPMVFCALDDIQVTGKNDQDDLKHFECVLQRFQEAWLNLRKDKCSFLAPSLEYLGHKIAKEGLQPLPSKVEAIQGAPIQREIDTRWASITLTPAEKKYPQLEREALEIVFGVTRFRNYLLGNSFTLCTDHKPLMGHHLSVYQYKIEFIKGTSNTESDVLSRLPMFTPEQNSREHDSEPVEMVLLMDALDSSPVTSDDIRVDRSQEKPLNLRCLFSRFGIPRTLISDNGTWFTSEEFRQFKTRNGICHLKTAPFHPSSNGLAERAVQTIKTVLRKYNKGEFLNT
ncbi:K02A2.6-like [Cordylochernes scorpioides]|uniref:K02A2.6-like n=1 Tax=Cordylochernes scorpioides TaxID=51811 RepID=A0ABY6KK26_9ARAC|nr:K02A2.6-like [Cordylochernes scorpioides]